MPSVKSNWRDSVKLRSTEVVTCDTPLPVDIGLHRTPLMFNVRPVPQQIIDTKNIRILVKFRVLKKQPATDDQPEKWVGITRTDKVCVHNNFGFGIFEDVHLHVNGVLVETAQREYPRTSYIKNLLFKNSSEKRMLQSAMFYEDLPGYMDMVMYNPTINMGEAVRTEAIFDPKIASFIAPVYLDLLQADNYFPDHVGLTLHFYPTQPTNCLICDIAAVPELRVEIVEAQLHVPRCQLSTQALKSFTTQYESVKVLSYVNPKEVMSFSRSLNINQLPKKLAIVVLDENQYHGVNKPSSINFKHHNVKSIRVRCNGQTYPTAVGMTMDFDKKDYREPYTALFTQLQATCPHFFIDHFDNGYAIFGIDLPPGHRPTKIENGGLYGTCDVDVDFAIKPTENLIVLIYCFYDSQVTFNSTGITHNSAEVKL
jgi:hypothetical protein